MRFKIRCSAIGQIMTNPRSKKELLSATTKTYCEDWFKEIIYGHKKQIKSKYLDKGNICEDESIDFISDYLGEFLVKNEDYFEDDHIKGTPDLITPTHVYDVKNSWDCYTFPIFKDDIPSKDYWWQLQGYMALTGKDKAKLIYTLMDTPEDLIESEYNKHVRFNQNMDIDAYDKFKERFIFSNAEDKYRIKIFEFDRDNEAIEQIRARVEECREYIFKLSKL